MSVRQSETGFKPDAPPRTYLTPPPFVVTLVVPADGPVAAFACLTRTAAAGDFRSASHARKALRGLGWSVAPCSPKGGG
jgi:hypothetical protein